MAAQAGTPLMDWTVSNLVAVFKIFKQQLRRHFKVEGVMEANLVPLTLFQVGEIASIAQYVDNKKGTRWSAYLRHVMPDPREHIRPITFLKYHATQDYIVFGPISQW